MLLTSKPYVESYLVFVDNPTLELLVKTFVAASVFDYIVDGEMLKTGILGQDFAMTSLAHAWRPSDDYVWLGSHGEFRIQVVRGASQEVEFIFQDLIVAILSYHVLSIRIICGPRLSPLTSEDIVNGIF